MPRYSRDSIRKGVFLTGGDCPGTAFREARAADKALIKQYPEFETVLKSIGPSIEGLEALAAEHRALEARLALLREKVKAVRKR